MEYHQWLLHFRTKFNINIFAQIFIGKNHNYLLHVLPGLDFITCTGHIHLQHPVELINETEWFLRSYIMQPNFPLKPTFKNHDKSAKTAQEVDEILHN